MTDLTDIANRLREAFPIEQAPLPPDMQAQLDRLE